MNNLHLSYSPYILKLKKSFSTAKGEIRERKGFIIILKDDKGNTGAGDCAPFPEFGSESYDEAERELSRIKINLSIDILNLQKSIEDNLAYFNYYPSLKFGIEQALLKLFCKKNDVTLNELLNVKSSSPIEVNGAIGFLPPEESAKKSEELIKKGFSTIKIKTGRDDFEDDFNSIKAVKDAVGNEVKLRIDANGKWELEEAVDNLKKLEQFNLEYAEQPVLAFNDFVELKNKVKITLAADESIRTVEDALLFINNKAAGVLILKPMMIGGIIPTLKIIEAAEENGIKVVVTSSFESAIGRSMAVFAASTLKEKTAHGLGIADYFEKDLVDDPYPVNEGKIFLTR